VDVEWSELLLTEPPFIPELEGEADSSYFVCEDDDETSSAASTEQEGALTKDKNFMGFTFNKHNM
jgi:hypothetical protein